MDQENAFLDAILQEPEEMAHRLVFADWLEDRGDAPAHDRAEFIRAQIERAALHPAHPRARVLLRRESELLARHEPAWTGRVAVLAGRWRFHRGFVEEVSVHVGSFLRPDNELFQITPVSRLHLRGLESPAISLGIRGIVRETLIDRLRRIHVLDLNREPIGEATAQELLDLPPLPQLEALLLGFRHQTAVALLFESEILASLKTLQLSVSPAARGDLLRLLHSPHLERLEALSLSASRLGDSFVPMLGGAPVAANLRSLSLGHSSLTEQGVRDLLDSPLADSLESLDLSFNPLGVEGARLLARSGCLPRLTQLNLSRTGLGDEGVRVLADAPLLGQLLGLDLSLNRIGPDGAFDLAQRTQPTRLMTLDLIYNSVNGRARRRLEERFGAEVCLFDR